MEAIRRVRLCIQLSLCDVRSLTIGLIIPRSQLALNIILRRFSIFYWADNCGSLWAIQAR